MDIADQADQQSEVLLKAAIGNACNSHQKKLNHTGKCHYCEANVISPKLYCDGHCATKHSKQGA